MSTDTKAIIGASRGTGLVVAGPLSAQNSSGNASLNTRIDDVNHRIDSCDTRTAGSCPRAISARAQRLGSKATPRPISTARLMPSRLGRAIWRSRNGHLLSPLPREMRDGGTRLDLDVGAFVRAERDRRSNRALPESSQ